MEQVEAEPNVSADAGLPPGLRILNLFDRPLFALGFLLLAWLAVDGIWFSGALGLSVPAPLQAVRNAAPIFLTILTPATLGYWTNFIAIKMLFHPRRPNAVWQGLLPAKRDVLIEQVAQRIHGDLLHPEKIKARLESSGVVSRMVGDGIANMERVVADEVFQQDLEDLLHDTVADILREPTTVNALETAVVDAVSRWTKSGKTPALFKKPLGGPIRKALVTAVQKLPDHMPPLMATVRRQLTAVPSQLQSRQDQIHDILADAVFRGVERLDLREVIRHEMRAMDQDEFEAIMLGDMNHELKFIMVAGGLLGALLGMAIVWVWFRAALALVALALVGIYFATVRDEPTL